MEGRSQHLSRLTQLKLQIISNIWSWNYKTEENTERCYKWLPFTNESQWWEQTTTPPSERQDDGRTRPWISHWEQLKPKFASTHKRVLDTRYLESCETLFQTWFSECFFDLLVQTASSRLQTWPSCQALHSRRVWCCWPPWSASLPPPGSPRWAWLSPERWWCGSAGEREERMERERESPVNETQHNGKDLQRAQELW